MKCSNRWITGGKTIGPLKSYKKKVMTPLSMSSPPWPIKSYVIYLNFNQFHDSLAFYGGGQAIMVELITLGKEANSGGELLRIGQYVLGQKDMYWDKKRRMEKNGT